MASDGLRCGVVEVDEGDQGDAAKSSGAAARPVTASNVKPRLCRCARVAIGVEGFENPFVC